MNFRCSWLRHVLPSSEFGPQAGGEFLQIVIESLYILRETPQLLGIDDSLGHDIPRRWISLDCTGPAWFVQFTAGRLALRVAILRLNRGRREPPHFSAILRPP